MLTACSASGPQVISSAPDAEPATRDRDTSYAFDRRDTHKAELPILTEGGKSHVAPAAELVQARCS